MPLKDLSLSLSLLLRSWPGTLFTIAVMLCQAPVHLGGGMRKKGTQYDGAPDLSPLDLKDNRSLSIGGI